MQTQHIIIYAGIALGLALMTYYIRRAILRALVSRYAAGLSERNAVHSLRIDALNKDIDDLNHLQRVDLARIAELSQQVRTVRATPFTRADHLALLEAATTLRLAKDTWDAFPGTEPYRLKAINQAHLLGELAFRVLDTINSADTLNAESLDTQLIEWLDREGDLVGELETSAVRFPHDDACPAGYPHIRDALREAFEQGKARKETELQISPVTVNRDAEGWWSHPDYLSEFDDELTEAQFNDWCTRHQVVTKITYMESDVDADVFDAYMNDGQVNCSAWEIQHLAEPGWFILSIHDAEDGPVCVWGRHQKNNHLEGVAA